MCGSLCFECQKLIIGLQYRCLLVPSSEIRVDRLYSFDGEGDLLGIIEKGLYGYYLSTLAFFFETSRYF